MQCKQQNDLIIGGDFNASIGETTDREEDQAAGPHGLGRTNPAGHDLLNWCHEQGLAWGNSFFEHNLRGTWQCPSRNSWHEIDGFLVRQKNRSKCLKSVNTVTTARSLSDHWPKSLTGWLQRPTPRRQPRAQKNNTNWEALKDPITRAKFQSETERETEKQSGGRWTELIAGIAKAGKRVCGTKGKVALSPWLDRHEREIKGFKEKITTLIKRAKEASTQEGKHRWTVFRKQVRKLYKLAKKKWEEEWWLEKVQETETAERKGEIGTIYKTLRKIGTRDLQTVQEELFTPGEFKCHFMKVSEHHNERDIVELMKTARSTPKRTDPRSAQAAVNMEREITYDEFEEQLLKMKDGAAGNDGVRVAAVKALTQKSKKKVYETIIRHVKIPPREWQEDTREGWVIPLHKKDRNKLDNYRGVCLLPLISRIVARIYATRIREWAETIEVLGENQNGFREGRSTCDSTQILIRLDKEARRVMGRNEVNTDNRPGAVLLNITKAYPRVKRPLLWEILGNLGMQRETLAVLKGLHEGTIFKVKEGLRMAAVERVEGGLCDVSDLN